MFQTLTWCDIFDVGDYWDEAVLPLPLLSSGRTTCKSMYACSVLSVVRKGFMQLWCHWLRWLSTAVSVIRHWLTVWLWLVKRTTHVSSVEAPLFIWYLHSQSVNKLSMPLFFVLLNYTESCVCVYSFNQMKDDGQTYRDSSTITNICNNNRIQIRRS